MLVLIADSFEKSGLDALATLGCQVEYQPKLKDQVMVEALGRLRPDVLVVRSTQVTEAMLDAGPLKLVVRAGAGHNTIDVAAASKRGIFVANCPGKNSIAVAELALGLIMALDRRIPENVFALRGGQWNKSEFSKARGLFGRTLGLIGVGQIGAEMIPRAAGLGMRVVAWSRSLTPARAAGLGIEAMKTPLDVAAVSDVVSVHLALNKETRGLIGVDFFNALRPGAFFVNTSRGEVVDEAALLSAITQRGIRAGLDVYANEPTGGTGEFKSAVAASAGVYGTHHIGASTEQAQEAIAAETVRIIAAFKETGSAPNAVNIAKRTPATCVLIVRHRDHPGVLARVLDAISAARINVQEMANVILDGAEAAVAQIHLETSPPPELLADLRAGVPDILDLSIVALKG